MLNPFSLEGKTVLITGASSGIGKSTAIECSRLGARLIITGRDKIRLNETYSSLNGLENVQIVSDITIESEILRLADSVPEIDGIVHCAGITNHMLFSFIKRESVNEMFNINFFTPLFLTKELFGRKKILKGSSIVFITSVMGLESSYIGGSIYSSTKGALSGLIKGLAIEYANKNIRVNSVMPGMIETPILKGNDLTQEQLELDKKRYPLKRYGKPEEVAFAVIYLLSSASSWTTGINLLIDGGRSINY